ncbi:MAG: YjbQ family protein [Chloroflexi bacterium]|nr:YjbQ family protein [Chloroflexota bacterium]
MIVTRRLRMETRGNDDVLDLTGAVEQAVHSAGLRAGAVTVFVTGSTAGLTTVEYEPGLVHDLGAAFERLIPRGIRYRHEERWGDDNGHSHVRAALLGPSIVIPFENGALTLGTWQQIVLVDFDTRPRTREVVLQIMGES